MSGLTLDLHEDSLGLDANDKEGGKMDKVSKEYSAPSQKVTCVRRSYDERDRI
jgi:hypothetical protein